jgi:hypothetical protein
VADTLVAVTNIKHNEDWIDAGSVLETDQFTDEELEHFVEIGAVEVPPTPPDAIVISKSALKSLPDEARVALRNAGFDVPEPEDFRGEAVSDDGGEARSWNKSMNKDELLQHAEGLDVDETNTKDEIIAALEDNESE